MKSRQFYLLPFIKLILLLALSLPLRAENEIPQVLVLGPSLDYDTSFNGQRYLALHKEPRHGWQLTAVNVTVTRSDPDTVEIGSSVQGTRALFRHSALREGAVTIAWLDDWPYKENTHLPPTSLLLLTRGDAIVLRLGQTQARVVLADTSTQFQSDGMQTVLYEALPDYYTASLLWAGDLDHDDRLDLLMSFSNDKNGQVCLFLSSQAEAGKLLKNVGCYFASG